MTTSNEAWPALPMAAWQETYATLHMWTQIVGKIRLAQSPFANHWWHSALYPTARGLTTSPMPCGSRFFEIEFDFIEHGLLIRRHDGLTRKLELAPRSVADFYGELMRTLRAMDLAVRIWPVPVEVPDPVPFEEDHGHAAYDREYVDRLRRILLQAAQVLQTSRSRFVGKCSPVHFFWGSFDLAVTRFSGRRAPPRKGADRITCEAYSHEVISHGFWPGMRASGPVERERAEGVVDEPAFYAYAAPEPEGLGEAQIHPDAGFYSAAMKEFILLYDEVRDAAAPEKEILAFVESTYERAADLAKWKRTSLERR